MERWSIAVWPTIVARLVYLPLYTFPFMVGGCVLWAMEYPIVLALRGSFSGPLPGWARLILGLAWLALAIPLLVLVHRIIRYFLDRATLRLTPTTLYLGRAERPVSLDRVRDAYFVTQHGLGRRKYRSAKRRQFDVLLLVLGDGSVVPLSPPPGTFTDLIPVTYAATANVAQFLHAIVELLEPKLREGEPLPPHALPFLHPMESNRLYGPGEQRRTGFWWTLARWTWTF
jgi:hypothetical protein